MGEKPENCYSRYHEEFTQIEEIGKGGCGRVFKALNNTDRQVYAVKRVLLRPFEVEENERLKREAELFARLKHDNIVRYFGAWIEKGVKKTSQSEIEWSTDSSEETDEEENAKKLSVNSVVGDEVVNHISYLYIQMELCERTLRDEIKDRLPEDKDKVARYFCEILEGLSHIHQNLVIHRDLKPENIFIKEGSIKIGDFGLAKCCKEGDLECRRSSDVGTWVYMAPEVKSDNGAALYDQKVDMFSLGIILFEMCYCFNTDMERAETLNKLKDSVLKLPESLENWQGHVIRCLVNHVVDERPTASVLRLSPLLPNLSPTGLDVFKVVNFVLSDRESKEYRHLIETCLKQTVVPPYGTTYDLPKPGADPKNQYCVEEYVKRIESVFQKHGATYLSTNLFVPTSRITECSEPSVVTLMTEDGMVVELPHNAKVSFARWVVWNQETSLTRYSTMSKYEKRDNSHPKRYFECVFDIVSPNKAIIYDAKILSVVWDICTLIGSKVVIFLNHTDLVKAALMTAGVQPQFLPQALELISSKGVECIGNLLVSNGPIEIALLQALLKFYGTPEDVLKNLWNTVIPECQDMVKQAIEELKEIINYAQLMGVEPSTFYTTLKWVDNIHLYSGMLCAAVSTHANQKHIIADGGCFDRILAVYRAELAHTLPDVAMQSATGITVYPDRLMKLLPSGAFQPQKVVLWCSEKGFVSATERVAKRLRLAGVPCLTLFDIKLSEEDIEPYDNDWKVFCTVQVKDTYCIVREKVGRFRSAPFYTHNSFDEAVKNITTAFRRQSLNNNAASLDQSVSHSFQPSVRQPRAPGLAKKMGPNSGDAEGHGHMSF